MKMTIEEVVNGFVITAENGDLYIAKSEYDIADVFKTAISNCRADHERGVELCR